MYYTGLVIIGACFLESLLFWCGLKMMQLPTGWSPWARPHPTRVEFLRPSLTLPRCLGNNVGR